MQREIPDFLSHLPVHRGYPVPYFVPQDHLGVYQLKYASQQKMEECIRHHRCCVCFQPLEKGEYYFISGPMGFKTNTDSHPPMHRRCAEYSLDVCPHLYFEKTDRTTDPNNGAEWQIREKPKELFLVESGSIKVFMVEKVLLIKYSGIKSFKRFAYENGEIKAIESKERFDVFVIYKNPSDYPDKYVLRRFCNNIPDPKPLAVENTIEEVRLKVPPGKVFLQPTIIDDPVIIETYV